MTYFTSERGRAAAIKRHHSPDSKPFRPPIDKDVRRLRAYQIIQRKIVGETNEQIAKALNISVDTVHREMRFAKRMGLLQQAEERLLDELAPAAISAYLKLMAPEDEQGRPLPPDEKSLTAATNVLQLIEKLGNRQEAREAQREDQRFSLATILARRAADSAGLQVSDEHAAEHELGSPDSGPSGASAAGRAKPPILDGTIVGADPPTTESHPDEREPARTLAASSPAQDPQEARASDGQDGPRSPDGPTEPPASGGLQPFPLRPPGRT